VTSTHCTAVADPALRARILERRRLLYDEPAATELDRGDHVRAASGLAWLGDTLAIIQDDTSFVALLRPDGRLGAVALPAGPDGRRRFESRRGNKADKLDLESCVVVPGPRGPRLIAFGSGSLPQREVVVVVEGGVGGVGDVGSGVRVVAASELYTAVHTALVREGILALNLEGAVIEGDRLCLFQRGNGAPADAVDPVDAAVELSLGEVLRWLDDRGPVPAARAATWYHLGTIGGVRYGFTDVHAVDGRALFLAAAEASPNAIDDGAVHGTRIGVLDGCGARFCELLDADGQLAAVKAEGIAAVPGRSDVVYVVLDADDPDLPSELCTVELTGPWRG
jgi:hypothetical protein